MKCLIVVDMQKDFINGSLGTAEAEQIVPMVVSKVKNYDGKVIFTYDTHYENYLETQEGKHLPVSHCVKGLDGWQLEKQLDELCYSKGCDVYHKVTFGSKELAQDLLAAHMQEPIEEIELCGLCTDICVVSNALLLKAFLPEVPIVVDSSCCAGVSPRSHKNALDVMKMCQIIVK